LKASFSTWLRRVAVNACLDHLRRQQARPEVQPPVDDEGEPQHLHEVADDRASFNPERALRAQEIRARVEAALTRLNPRERMVFELRHYQGLKLSAIGALVGSSEETAKNCLFRATQKLRGELGDLM
jgi:RNA polymerase sigma-70 factor (ECF subfamily)